MDKYLLALPNIQKSDYQTTAAPVFRFKNLNL
jgi:hypothetical protein